MRTACLLAIALAAFPLHTAAATSQPDGREFPIGVWLQAPANVARYQAIGINHYIGLWEGPTEAQLSALQQAHMKLFCDQNAEALKPRWKDVIVGWLQDDEPYLYLSTAIQSPMVPQ